MQRFSLCNCNAVGKVWFAVFARHALFTMPFAQLHFWQNCKRFCFLKPSSMQTCFPTQRQTLEFCCFSTKLCFARCNVCGKLSQNFSIYIIPHHSACFKWLKQTSGTNFASTTTNKKVESGKSCAQKFKNKKNVALFLLLLLTVACFVGTMCVQTLWGENK